MRWKAVRALAIAAGALWAALGGAASAQPTGVQPAAPAPTVCSVGAYVLSVRDIDSVAHTFKADLWLWSVCPTKDVEPLKTMDFVDAVETRTSLDALQQRGNSWWATRRVSGTFSENFETDSFPFDHHPLVIEMEEGGQDARTLLIQADQAHSGIDPAIAIPGWRLRDFAVRSGVIVHPTTFGDPSLPKGESRRAAVHLVVHAERAHFAIFVKLTITLYISALLVLISLMFDVGDTDLFIGRIGLHASALFAVVLNWVAVGATVGHHESLSLLDAIHVATLVLILSTSMWSVYAYRAVVRGVRAETVRLWDERSAAVFLAVFLVVNAWLFTLAIRKGSDNPPAYATAGQPVESAKG